MKNFKVLTLLWITLIAGMLAGCWKETNNSWDFIIEDTSAETDAVINYNDTIVDLVSECIVSEDEIRDSYDKEESSIEDIQTAINNTIEQCTTAKKSINSIWDWEWDSLLKDWVLDIIEKYITYYSKFNELLPYIEKEDVTEEESKEYESLLAEIETLDAELDEANNNLVYIQEQFAKNHWFELEEEESDVYNDELEEEESDVYNDELAE